MKIESWFINLRAVFPKNCKSQKVKNYIVILYVVEAPVKDIYFVQADSYRSISVSFKNETLFL